MKMRILILTLSLLVSKSGLSQQTYYYYNNQQTPVTLSETYLFVKFTPGLNNTQKLETITNAGAALYQTDTNNIPNVVKIKSTITRTTVWVYPCGVPPSGELKSFTYKPDTFSIANKPSPCEGCPPPPPDCTPYTVVTITNNINDVFTSLNNSVNIKSVSKAISILDGELVGTCEDFFIKLKPQFTLNDLFLSIPVENYVYTDESSSLGLGVYKFRTNNIDSKNCISITNSFYQTGKCEFATPNFYNNIKPAGSIKKIINNSNLKPLTTDPLFAYQWNLKNTGQNGGSVGADIRVEPAWIITKGNGIKVAVIDNGIQLNHQDIQANLIQGYDPSALIPSLDDGGASPLASACNVDNDGLDHGTAVAGIIGAISNNNLGIAGVAPECKIVPVYVVNNDELFANSINWAETHGIDVINNSNVLTLFGDLTRKAIHNFVTKGRGLKGGIFVSASGNLDGNHSSNNVGFPAQLEDAIAVGAITRFNNRKVCNPLISNDWGSNFGEELDIVAPGDRLPSLTVQNGTCDFYGTSAAAPHVAGVAALVLSANPNLTNAEVKRILNFSCNKVGPYCYNWTPNHPDGTWNIYMGYGRINASNAVQLALNATTFSTPTYNVPQSNIANAASQAISIIIPTSPCTTFSGSIFGYRTEVTTNISFPFTNNPLIICSSNGWSAANPNAGNNYADVKSFTNTSAVLRTYVYTLINSAGWGNQNIPVKPENVKFNYSIIGTNGSVVFQQSKSSTILPEKIKPINFEFDNPGPTNDVLIDFNNNKNELSIYPNPTNSTTFISSKDIKLLKIEKVEVCSISGEVIKTFEVNKISKSILSIDFSTFSNGAYFIKVHAENKIITKKLIKQ